MERHFDKQIEKLRTRIIKMSSLVAEQFEFAVRAAEEESRELANLVIARDRKVNDYDVKIEKGCMKIFALNHPVAMDLRLNMSALTINGNLERIGDVAAALAQRWLELGEKPTFFDRTAFREMATIAKEMLDNAIDSFIENNAKLAEKTIEDDVRLERLDDENVATLVEIMRESPENVAPGVATLEMCRLIERLGDYAVNIAEDIYFIVEAETIKHNYEKFLFGADEESDDDDD
jgi:phosphate transport system protein